MLKNTNGAGIQIKKWKLSLPENLSCSPPSLAPSPQQGTVPCLSHQSHCAWIVLFLSLMPGFQCSHLCPASPSQDHVCEFHPQLFVFVVCSASLLYSVPLRECTSHLSILFRGEKNQIPCKTKIQHSNRQRPFWKISKWLLSPLKRTLHGDFSSTLDGHLNPFLHCQSPVHYHLLYGS